MTMREAYQTLDTEETLNEYKEKDIEEDWPTEPRPLKKRTTLTYMALCWDVLVTLVPVVFFGKSVVHVVPGLFLLLPLCVLFSLIIHFSRLAEGQNILFEADGVFCYPKQIEK